MSQDYLPRLSHLVRLGVTAIALQVYHIPDTIFPENMMTSYSFNETQPQ